MQVIKTCQICGKNNLYVSQTDSDSLFPDNNICLNCIFTPPEGLQNVPFGAVTWGGKYKLVPHQPTEYEIKQAQIGDDIWRKMMHEFKIRYNLQDAENKRVAAYGEGHRNQVNIGDIAEGRQDPESLALREQARIDKAVILYWQNLKFWPEFDLVEVK